jgi:hypothetical protein
VGLGRARWEDAGVAQVVVVDSGEEIPVGGDEGKIKNRLKII